LVIKYRSEAGSTKFGTINKKGYLYGRLMLSGHDLSVITNTSHTDKTKCA